MANQNKVLIVSAYVAEDLQEKINTKLSLLPQYRVVTASSACSHYPVAAGTPFSYVVTTIVLELIPSSEQSSNATTGEMSPEEILAREA